MYKGIIFDIDGTLTSTNELIYASFNHILQKYEGITYSDEQIIALFGPTEEQILVRWYPDKAKEVVEEYFDFYKNELPEMASAYDGIHNLLEIISKKNIPLGIFTGKGRRAAELTLEGLGLRDYFTYFASGDDVENHKPAADGIVNYLKTYNFQPHEVLMIGDAPADIKAARSAGTPVASVVWDSYAKDEVLKLNSELVFYSVAGLQEYLLSTLPE